MKSQGVCAKKCEKMQKNLCSLFFTNVSDSNRSELIRIIKAQKIENKNLKTLVQTIDKATFTSNNTQEFAAELFNEFANNSEIKNIITDLIYLSKCYENLTEKEVQVAIKETTNKIELLRRKEEIKQLRLKSRNVNKSESDEVQYQMTVNEKLKSENMEEQEPETVETPEVVETEKPEEEKSDDINLTNEIRSLKTEIKVLIDIMKALKKDESIIEEDNKGNKQGVDLEEIKKGLVI